jgi:hypothetical protein
MVGSIVARLIRTAMNDGLPTLSVRRGRGFHRLRRRLLGVSREAMGNAISHKRLATGDCNGRSKLYRPDVLTLKVRPKVADRGEAGKTESSD